MQRSAEALRSFGRRKGRKLRPGPQSLYDTLLPKIQIVIPPPLGGRLGGGLSREEQSVDAPIPTLPLMGRECWLEIGFGGGEHLVHLATSHPDIQLIGCEPYVNGIAGLLAQIDEQELKNIRIYTDDVRELLATFPDNALARAYILYPDPWPKARHHKRRLIQKPLLDSLARVMKPGAELRIATDWADYATWILEQLLPHPAFNWQAEKADDWQKPWQNWIPTRYEQKARREGRDSSYLIFTRKNLPLP